MRKASAPILFLVGLLVVSAIGGLTFGIAALAGVGDDDESEAAETATTEPVTPNLSLAADQVAVTGVATSITIVGAALTEVIVPTVTTPSAGLGAGAEFEGITVDGEDATIVWDAGRPLAFAPATPLRLDPWPLNLTANPTGIVLAFVDETVHRVLAGDYGMDAPVAVSTGGLARPEENVIFRATEGATVSFTGGATATILPIAMSATGPGQVILDGTFRVSRPDGTTSAVTHLELPQGSFEVSFAPRPDGTGYDLSDVLLEGTVTTR